MAFPESRTFYVTDNAIKDSQNSPLRENSPENSITRVQTDNDIKLKD